MTARVGDHAINGRIGGLTRWAHEKDPAAAMAPARRGLDAKFAREVDPDGVLPPAELEIRIARARRAHMARLAKKSAEARRRTAA
jgi:hypothetical protein